MLGSDAAEKDEGGAGTMDWDSHVNAYYAQWIRRYLDPRQTPWKAAVDHIFRDQIGLLGTGRAFMVSSHFQDANLSSINLGTGGCVSLADRAL